MHLCPVFDLSPPDMTAVVIKLTLVIKWKKKEEVIFCFCFFVFCSMFAKNIHVCRQLVLLNYFLIEHAQACIKQSFFIVLHAW